MTKQLNDLQNEENEKDQKQSDPKNESTEWHDTLVDMNKKLDRCIEILDALIDRSSR